MSSSNMSDKDFTVNFTYMLAAMSALVVFLYILANTIGAKPESAAANDSSNMVTRVAGAMINAVIPAANAAPKGKTVYDSSCGVCHVAGVAGAPKLDDKAGWKARVATGKKTLYDHAIKGYQGKKGMMPPKGGFTNLSDAEVKAAVDYMIKTAK